MLAASSHLNEHLGDESQLRLAIDNKQLRSMLEDERIRTGALNEKLIELEQLNRGMEVILERIKQDPLAVVPPTLKCLLPTQQTILQVGEHSLPPYDQLFISIQELRVEVEDARHQLSESQQQLKKEQDQRGELENQLERALAQIKSLEEELGQERSERSQAILEAVEAESDRFNRQLEERAAIYENNERILQNNVRLLEESVLEKQEMNQLEKDRMLNILEQLQEQVQQTLRQLEREQKRTAEKEQQVVKLSNLLCKQEEKSTLAQNTYNDELEKKQGEIETLRSKLVINEDFEDIEDDPLTTRQDASERLDDNPSGHKDDRMHLLMEENNRLKEALQAAQTQLQQCVERVTPLTKIKSTESLTIFKQLEAGQFVQDTFKYSWRDADERQSNQDRLQEQPYRERPNFDKLRDSIGNSQRHNEKVLARYEQAVSENTRVMNMFLKEQEDRLTLNKQKQQLESKLNHAYSDIQKLKQELTRNAKSATMEMDRLKLKYLNAESSLKQKEQELQTLKEQNKKTTRSKIRTRDDSEALTSQTFCHVPVNLLTEMPCELMLSPREKELIRLRRETEQLTHQLTQQKNSNVLLKQAWNDQLAKVIRRTVDAKEKYWQLQENYEVLSSDYEQLRSLCRKKGISC